VDADVVVVGGGIVGLSTAYSLSHRNPSLSILLLEKEASLASHQTGRNSGVIHSGIYYKPGSLKAETCRVGKARLERFCADFGVPMDRCGKVIVAVDETELEALAKILERGNSNGVECRLIETDELRELEPAAAGVKAIHVPETGIVDYSRVCAVLGELLVKAGHQIELGEKVVAIQESDSGVEVSTGKRTIRAKWAISCAGLYSDRVAKMAGIEPKAKIVPFRGEYFRVTGAAAGLCRNLIYPVPDPSFPFLGVHFTRMIGGGTECGPNAVPSMGREAYRKTDINPGELWETLTYSGFLRVAGKHLRTGFAEIYRSASKRAFVRALQRLVPAIQADDLVPIESGIRAQAVLPDGSLVDDFCFEQTARCIHVVNAPSPAATAALAIGDVIVDRMQVAVAV
jgi:(S)-2-hydroxyglutarate dehydrogenase